MQLWFAPNSDVPLYRQLVTQVTLAVLSGDLKPGDRLPSTRELARRFAIHPNTISAGYRQLEREGWTETRHGSGVYIRSKAEQPRTPEQVLDLHIAGFFKAVRELNLPSTTVRVRIAEWLASPPPDHFLLIEPDPNLSKILLTELRQTTSLPVREATPDQCSNAKLLEAAVPLCRPSQAATIRAALPSGIELLTLQITSATTWLTPWMPAPKGHLLGIVSIWPEFLQIARTMLAAAGVPVEAILLRDASKPRWHRGLAQTSGILCDAFTATLPQLPRGPKTIVFPLLAESNRELLARYATTFGL